MNQETTPTWLKIMQNGAIGEARAKAFLIDRFWILERSVDIDGADLIIQRKVTNKNILDKDAPRLGVVQVKFYNSSKTDHYIPKIYILDNEDKPRDEFFVLCHTGTDDKLQTYFLTAKDVEQNFSISNINQIEKFRLPGNLVLQERYRVTSNRNTLNRIEKQLELADFTKNRKFISWSLPSSDIDPSAILPEFSEPIPNHWGKIPDEFKELKNICRSTMVDIEEVYDKFKLILEETSPLKALETLEELKYELQDGRGKWYISLPDNLYDEDFHTVCQNHIEKLEFLKQKGLLDKYIGLKDEFREKISVFLCENYPIDPNKILSTIVKFDTENLDLLSMESNLIEADRYWNIPRKLNEYNHIELKHNQYSGIKAIDKGKFEFYWLVGRYHISEKYKDDICSYFKEKNFSEYTDCIEYMYDNLDE